jgi:hypothetical protein
MPLDIVAGGQGTADDVALVAAELARLPAAIAAELARQRIRIVACRLSVTDFATELAAPDQVPEGWPAGSSWTAVPGAYIPARRAVVIATRGPDAGGARRIPAYGEGHGARSLAVHETVHGYDYASNALKSLDPAFRQAWITDRPILGAEYFSGAEWGPRESYAESAARRFGSDQSQADAWPHLAAFWAHFQPFAPGRRRRLGRAIGHRLPPDSRLGEPLGHGVIEADGTIQLDLTASSPSGAVGHARLTYRPGDAAYEAVLAQVSPGRARLSAPARQAEPAEQVLVWPFGGR